MKFLGLPIVSSQLQIARWAYLGIVLLVTAYSTGANALDADRQLGQYHHTAWTQREGAPRDVFSIAQTPDGFLWLASPDGLYRFDGFSFELMGTLGGVSIKGKSVVSLLTDKNGSLWVGFIRSGLARYVDGRLTWFASPGQPLASANFLAQTEDGSVWVKSNGKLGRVENGEVLPAEKSWGFGDTSIHTMFLDSRHTLWVTTPQAPAGGPSYIESYFLKNGEHRFRRAGADFDAEFVAAASDGKVWGCGDKGLQYVDSKDDYQSTATIGGEACGQLLVDRDGALWLHNVSGLAHIAAPNSLLSEQPSTGSLMPDHWSKADGLTSSEILFLFEDRDGNIWLATTAGIDRFRTTTMVPVTLPGRNGKTLIADAGNGSVWVQRFSSPLLRVNAKAIAEFPQAVDSQAANTLYASAPGTVFYASTGVFRFDGGASSTALPSPGVNVTTLFPRAMTIDGDGALWVAGGDNGAVARFHDGRWSVPAGEHGFPRRWSSTALLTDSRGRVWFAFLKEVLLLEHGEARLLTQAETGIDVGVLQGLAEGHEESGSLATGVWPFTTANDSTRFGRAMVSL